MLMINLIGILFVLRTSNFLLHNPYFIKLPVNYVSLLQIVRINGPDNVIIAEMKDFPARLVSRIGFFVFVFSFYHLVLWAQNPALLSGTVTNGNNGNTIIGAKISVNNQTAYSVTGGNYSVGVTPVGTYIVTCAKAGFDEFSSSSITFQQGVPVTLNIQLLETANPPVTVSALLDTVPAPKVLVNWQQPVGDYEIIYDDGIQEDFTVWATHGNMNAVKFTPVSYPAKVTGGSVHIGTQSNYPSGSNPLVPFQIAIYNATGANGTPGTAVAGPFDVIPTELGWIGFTVPVPPVITSGNFYIVMIQGGNAPNAAGMAIDKTNTALRSYQKFVTGGAPWLPADGNFMMRAIVSGTDGPLDLEYLPGSIVNHQVWRLRQGEEMNPYIWTPIGVQTSYSLTDYSWPSLPCGPFRWAVKTQYTGNRWSSATFSNLIGKCWTAPVTVHIDLTCTSATLAGTNAELKNLVYPDTLYTATLDTSGIVLFPKVWKGTYELKITRFNYQTQSLTASISHDTTLFVILQQETAAPSNLVVNDKSLKATWDRPKVVKELFAESWSGGNFITNEWTIEGGYNWFISQTFGNPVPSALFGWNPQVTNYNQSLTSKSLSGENSTILTLLYDITLDNFANTTVNKMAVELWDGNTWHLLHQYDNTKGSFQWTGEKLDISAYTNMTFRIRFRASGGDSYDINGWYIDNIKILEEESASNLSACILGYYFFLDNAIIGYVTDTTFVIPGNMVQYGTSYNACVQTIFASGNSSKTCSDFTSRYLIPPTGLSGTNIEDAAYLAWNQPVESKGTSGRSAPPPGLLGYYIYRDGNLLDSLLNPDTLFYYDFDLDPDTYFYGVSAKYDLTSYGFPGQTDESIPDGPVSVTIIYGRLLPFFEPWTQGSFTFNDWTFSPEQGNWMINADEGNPLPDAEFPGEPPRNDYEFYLESPVLNAMGVQCAKIWLDFDYSLVDNNLTSQEQLLAEIYYNNRWHKIMTFTNNGDVAWTAQHFEISIVKGKTFRIRFTAKGLLSTDIISWNIDNIHIYSVCNPPVNLAGDAIGYDVQLTWSSPDCSGNGFLLNEGFEEQQFPPPNWTQTITNTNATWSHSDAASFFGVHSGSFSAGVMWDYYHQDEWLIAHNIEITGNLQFWSFAYQGSVHLDHYYVKASADHGVTWDVLLDMSALPSYPGSSGYNQWNEPYNIDMSAWSGEVIDIAWQAVDGDNLGLWYAWAIDDCTIGTKKVLLSGMTRSSLEYDIYRQDSGSGDYNKINPEPVADTSYLDPSLPPGEYSYYVNAALGECTFVTSSDTINIDVITGINGTEDSRLNLFPNPADDFVNIASVYMIKKVEMMNFTGQMVYNNPFVENTKLQMNVSALQPGIYFARITTNQGIRTLKFTISR